MKDFHFENGYLFGQNYREYCDFPDCRDLFHDLRDEINKFVKKKGFDCSEYWESGDQPDIKGFKYHEEQFGKIWAYILALSNRPWQTKILLHLLEGEILKGA